MVQKKIATLQFKSFDHSSINQELPIKLKHLEKIIDNISKRYPSLHKSEIRLIVRQILETVREQLLLGDTIDIFDFLLQARLYGYCRVVKGKLSLTAKIQNNTPSRFKNANK